MHCGACHLWLATDTAPAYFAEDKQYSEVARLAGLERVRAENFALTLDEIEKVARLNNARLLDVGCAHGWFLDLARERGALVEGVEPDPDVRIIAENKGHMVYGGLFPDCVPPNRLYDVVTFNDVIEHIPNAHSLGFAIRKVVKPGGLLVLNLPTSSGLLFQLAAILYRLGWQYPWRRIWQRGFISPHLYYFSEENITRCFDEAGLAVLRVRKMKVFSWSGLWDRITHTNDLGRLQAVLALVSLMFIFPVYFISGKSDCLLVIFRTASRS